MTRGLFLSFFFFPLPVKSEFNVIFFYNINKGKAFYVKETLGFREYYLGTKWFRNHPNTIKR